MVAKTSNVTGFGYLWTIFVIVSGAYLVSGDSDGNSKSACSAAQTQSKISMSSGFVTAALAAVDHVGYGTCNPVTNTCSEPLLACPGEACCLPSAKTEKSCGCLETKNSSQGVKSVCADPKLLSVSGTGCTSAGAKQDISVQISLARKQHDCVAKTESKLTVLENGNILVEIKHISCSSVTKDDTSPVVTLDLKVSLAHYTFELKKNHLRNTLKNMDTPTLAAAFEIETLEQLLAVKKTLVKFEVTE